MPLVYGQYMNIKQIRAKIAINAFQLKMIAVITMLIDHIGAIFFQDYIIFRFIGRISFPIFCFLLVEGFFNTKDIKKYLLRLGMFALISEIPFDLLFSNSLLSFNSQNIFLELFIGILMLFCISRSPNIFAKIGIALAFCAVSFFSMADYGITGMAMMLTFYVCRKRYIPQIILVTLINYLHGFIQWFAVTAMIPIGLYNGKQGRKLKYFFYIFYPAHLLILYIIRLVLL